METGLEGRVVIVTGGASGIGKATVEAFADEGAIVVVGDLDVSDLAGAGERVHPVEADLSSTEGCEALAQAALAVNGRIDALVNNVGVCPVRESFLDVGDADWQSTMDINFYSMVRMSRAVLPHMVQAGGGSIVSIASEVARQPDVFFVDYGVSKAAVLSVAKALSMEFGKHGIRSNAVSPGPTRTPLWDRPGGFADALAEQFGLEKEAAIDHFAKEVRNLPLGKIGRPQDVAAAVVFLTSDLASQVTGSEYCVDGGIVRAA